jgi:hypothetical protein
MVEAERLVAIVTVAFPTVRVMIVEWDREPNVAVTFSL